MFEITWHKIWCIMNESYGRKLYIYGKTPRSKVLSEKLRCMDCPVEDLIEAADSEMMTRLDRVLLDRDSYIIFTDQENIPQMIHKMYSNNKMMFWDYRFLIDFDLSPYMDEIFDRGVEIEKETGFTPKKENNALFEDNGKIYVITHKEILTPEDPLYERMRVGNSGEKKNGYLYDDINDSISEKNKEYCELTGIYWLWKNVTTNPIGICHYRRYFVNEENQILTQSDIKQFLEQNEIILPVPMKFKCMKKHYLPNALNILTQYQQEHYIRDLHLAYQYLSQSEELYVEAFLDTMKNEKCYGYNMMITSKNNFDRYCAWLFPILEYVEDNRKIKYPDRYQRRVYGFLSERLLNVWIHKNGLKVRELKIIQKEF